MTSLAFAAPPNASTLVRGRAVRSARRRVVARPRAQVRMRVRRVERLAVAHRAASWELRSFVAAAAAIALALTLALAYLAASTGVSSTGYASGRLQAQRDELRRQNALLELELARLGSPARIEVDAKRLGLVRVPYVPVVTAGQLAAAH